jgi:hypothetical protein
VTQLVFAAQRSFQGTNSGLFADENAKHVYDSVGIQAKLRKRLTGRTCSRPDERKPGSYGCAATYMGGFARFWRGTVKGEDAARRQLRLRIQQRVEKSGVVFRR